MSGQRTLGQVVLAFACMVWFASATLAAPQAGAAGAVEKFVAHLAANEAYSPAARAKGAEIVAALQGDPATLPFAISEALREVSPEFRAATDLLAREKFGEAAPLFAKLAASPDVFLACEANYYHGRCLVLGERFEEAAPVLAAVGNAPADQTMWGGEAWFLLGVCESARLNRPAALAAFERFWKDYPQAPERMRVAAWQQIEHLRGIADGSLADVWLHMNFIRRKLAQDDAGDTTRHKQGQVIAMLDKLIREAEERECQCQGEGEGEARGQAKGQGKSGRGAGGQGGGPDGQKNEKTGPNDQTPYPALGKRQYRGEASPWSTLREKDREKVFHALEGKFPARYQQLIEQYYKNVQNDASE